MPDPEKAKARNLRYIQLHPDRHRESQRIRNAKYRKTHKQKTTGWLREDRARDRLWLAGIKDVPCADCGGRFPPECMDFDHVRGVKRRGVGGMVSYRRASIIQEIAKCDIVCSNCHRMRTERRRKMVVA